MAKKLSTLLSRIHYSIPLLLGALLLLGAVSCQAGQAGQGEPQAAQVTETSLPGSPEPTTTAAPEMAAVDGQAPDAEPEEVNQCLVCHADQGALRDTADPVALVESESSGEG